MTIQSLTKVYSAGIWLQAVAVENTLESAGIEATVSPSENGYDVAVPTASAADARELLNPVPHGEIFYASVSPVCLAGEAA